MGAGAKFLSGLGPQGPRPAASMAGPQPWNTIVSKAGVVSPHYRRPPLPARLAEKLGIDRAQPPAYEAWKERVGGLVPFNDPSPLYTDKWSDEKKPWKDVYELAGKPTITQPEYRFDKTALTAAQKHHDRMRDLREKKQETLAELMKYGQKDLGHFKKGAQQLNIGPQGKSEFKITPMMEERSYVSLEDPTIETIDQYERKRRRV